MRRSAGALFVLLCTCAAIGCAKGGAANGGRAVPPLDDNGRPIDPYSEDGQAYCESLEDAYYDFVAANLACTTDADCAVVGDCGPNADFVAVTASAANEAYALAEARCADTWDGPVFDARCIEGKCELEERTDTCCGCP